MKISVLNAQKNVFEGVVSMAILPAKKGELSLMDDHEPIFVSLGKGYIRLKPLSKKLTQATRHEEAREEERDLKPIFVRQGVARMMHNELVVLIE